MWFLVLLLTFVLLFYLFVRKRNNYWNERNVYTVKTNPIFGTKYDFIRGTRNLREIICHLYNSAPEDVKYFGVHDFLKPKLFIKDPELINQVLAKDFSRFHDRLKPINGGKGLIYNIFAIGGEEWKFARNKLITAFSPVKLKQMYCLMEECANLLMDNYLKTSAKTEEPIDVKDLMARFALDVIGCSAFGLQFNTLKDPDSEFRNIGKMLFAVTPPSLLRISLQTIDPNLIKWLGISFTPEKLERFIYDLLRNAEQFRKMETNKRVDLLQTMLDIRDEDNEKGEGFFTDKHVASNMLIIYVAGFETTSSTLTLCLYEMAVNQAIQEKVIEEIRKVRVKNNGIIDYESLKELTYLDMVISETLRKHAPTGFTERRCNETCHLPGTSLVLKPGETVICPITALHYDPKYYPDPEKFDPDRFTPENIAQRPPHTYIPFGDGPRICIGMRFARVEIKCCLVTMLSKYRFHTCSKTEIPLKFSTRSLLHAPKNVILLTVKEFENN